MKKILFIASLLFAVSATAYSQNLSIEKNVSFIQPEQFEPTQATFKIIGVNDSTVSMFFELVERHPIYNGQTVRTGNVSVPKPAIDAIQIKYDGTVGDTTALNNLLAMFNLKVRHDQPLGFRHWTLPQTTGGAKPATMPVTADLISRFTVYDLIRN